MKVYLCYLKKNITNIVNEQLVKNKIAKSVSDIFNLLFDKVKPEDVNITRCTKIVNNYDIYIICSPEVMDDISELLKKNEKLKESVLKIIQEDQNSNIQYNLGTRFETNYEENILSSTDKKMMEVNDKKIMDIKDDKNGNIDDSELDYEKRSQVYVPVEPSYSFDRVILPKDTLEKIEEALNILKYENKVFNEWGLYEIQPHPSSSLSFFGPSGTGKTMAAEAIAEKLGKKILKVSYADVESKYHGEGPKMVKAIFLAAEREDAVLFFDEADSLLSKRLTNVSQGSEQAINSMRSQLLICLEEFRGIVIFATNLLVNYDQAFLTRLISVEFIKPDVDTRKKIWDVHIRPANDGKTHKLNIPLSEDVNTYELADKYEFVGREIRNAVISACISAAMQERDIVAQSDIVRACDKIMLEKESIAKAKDNTVSDKNKEVLRDAVVKKIKEGDVKNISELSEGKEV